MKLVIAIFLLCSFTGIAVFGFMAMRGDTHGHMSNCIAVLAKGSVCPEQSNAADYLAFHLNAFKNFSLAVLILFTLFLLVWPRVAVSSQVKQPCLSSFLRRLNTAFLPSQKLERLRWWALHENSPSFSIV